MQLWLASSLASLTHHKRLVKLKLTLVTLNTTPVIKKTIHLPFQLGNRSTQDNFEDGGRKKRSTTTTISSSWAWMSMAWIWNPRAKAISMFRQTARNRTVLALRLMRAILESGLRLDPNRSQIDIRCNFVQRRVFLSLAELQLFVAQEHTAQRWSYFVKANAWSPRTHASVEVWVCLVPEPLPRNRLRVGHTLTNTALLG